MSKTRPTAMLMVALLALAACGDPGANPDGGASDGSIGPPDPWVPPAEGALECELAADCPDGTFCDLGECIQECNVVDPCTGELTCIPRGRCADDATAPSDPPASAEHVASVTSDADVVNVGATDAMVMLQFSASPADQEIRYRVDPRVPWLRVTERRGTFTGALAVSLSVDRTGLAVGTHTGSVVLRTTAGDVSVPVQITQSFTGVYQGEIAYETPRDLGRVPVRIEVQDRGGFLDMRFLADDSPTFARAGTAQATTTAGISGTSISGSVVQAFTTTDLGTDSLFARDLGRDLQFTLQPTAAGGLEGTFTERWIGVFPAPVQVGGRISLARLADAEARDFTVALPPGLPGNPSANPPAISGPCFAVTAPVAGETGTACTATSTPSQLRVCGERLRDRATPFETAALVTTGSTTGTSGYDSLSNVCRTELDNPRLLTPGATPVMGSTEPAGCFHIGDYLCALTILENAASRSDTTAAGSAGEASARRAGVAMLLLNDHLVDAFEAPIRADGPGAESAVLDALRAGRSRARPAMRELFAPHVLESLRSTAPAVAASTDYRGLRRLAQLVARDRLAADQEASVLIRTQPATRTTTREQIHAQALDLVLGLVALSTIEQAQTAPPSPELGLFAEALTDLGRRSLQAGERIDPLGVPSTFVPFVYRATDPGTNFEQTLSGYRTHIMTATTDELAARAAIHEYEQNEDALRRELNSIGDQIRNRLTAICGSRVGMPAEPDLDACGENGEGELAVALASYEEAANAIRIAQARFDGLIARANIQRQRAAEVRRIRQETIEFITSTNAVINALEAQVIVIEAIQTALTLSANAQVWNGGASVGLGVASGILEAIQGLIRLGQQQLHQAQDLRVRMDEADIEFLNAMSALQEMLVGQAELQLEIAQATLAVATSGIRIQTLRSEVERLLAERELQEARALSGLTNDPAFRVLRSRAIEQAIASRDRALMGVYLSARAYEFETNTDLAAIETSLVPAMRAADIARFADCLVSSQTEFRTTYGSPQTFVDEISLREDVLGIRGPITDEFTGEVISEAEQFRRLLLMPSNLGPDGTVEISFSTSLNRGNGLFSTMVCNDQIRSIQVRLIGDGLGDDQARVYLVQDGASVQRGCDSSRDAMGEVLRQYEITPRRVEVQAGVNVMSTAPADTQLTGRSVAASEWRIAIPPGDVAPANADLDPTRVEDVIIRLEHTAISLSDSPIRYTPTCGG